ncbi:hypothetical protein [Pelosinus sp. UFO1]|uniref:hypothetical protein n=1 Tax=Pelosinus sp. UFO1 TaxID=484770 RepID=UPI0004D11301|nr:hypothetical protein [Pelosinus sp. UFO1]AIF49739.1 hypothetical protein UFO1_0178 [Pelosinus sp. UFO1]
MSSEDSENKSGFYFGAQNSNNSSSSNGLGLEISNSTSSSGFGVETPSKDPNSNYGGISRNEAGVDSFLNMLNMNHGNTKGIAGGEAYLGTITSSYDYDDDSIEDLCDEIEIDNGESWIERGSIFGSAIKIVTDFYNKFFSAETQSIGKVIGDIDKTIASAIEEVSSGGWDKSYRNIQLDGCIGASIAESSDETEIRFIGKDTNGIKLNGSVGEILSASGDGVDKSGSE